MLAYEGVPLLSSDSVAFDLFASLIGEYDKLAVKTVPPQISGNRTLAEVSKKQGVGCAESFKMVNQQYSDTGLLYWYAVADEIAVEHCVGELIFGVNMLSSSVTDEEVQRAKMELKRRKLASVTQNGAAATEVAKHVLGYGRHLTPAEYCQRVDAVDSEDLKRVAWKYLHDAEIAVSALGPLHGLHDYYHVRRNTSMWRY